MISNFQSLLIFHKERLLILKITIFYKDEMIIEKNLVPRIQNSRFLLTSDNITTPLYALCGIIRFVRLGHNIKNPKFDQNPLRIE